MRPSQLQHRFPAAASSSRSNDRRDGVAYAPAARNALAGMAWSRLAPQKKLHALLPDEVSLHQSVPADLRQLMQQRRQLDLPSSPESAARDKVAGADEICATLLKTPVAAGSAAGAPERLLFGVFLDSQKMASLLQTANDTPGNQPLAPVNIAGQKSRHADSDGKVCRGVYLDLLGERGNGTTAGENFMRGKLLGQMAATTAAAKRPDSKTEIEKNLASLADRQAEFEDIRALAAEAHLPFFVKTLDAEGNPQLKLLDPSALASFEKFLSACQPGVQAAPETKKTNALAAASGPAVWSVPNPSNPQDEQEWMARVAELAAGYYNKPYRYTSHKNRESVMGLLGKLVMGDEIHRRVDGKRHTVFRKKHGVAHGVRKGMLAGDIADLLLGYQKQYKNPFGIAAWLKERVEKDPYFVRKLQLAAVFSRSGRESEVDGDSGSYDTYMKRGAENFLAVAGKGSPLASETEAGTFADAIYGETKSEVNDVKNDHAYIFWILRACHHLDLRRMTSFSESSIRKNVNQALFPYAFDDNHSAQRILDTLWDRSGSYLDVIGDVNLTRQKGKEKDSAYADRFFTLNNDPQKLVSTLYAKRAELLAAKSRPVDAF